VKAELVAYPATPVAGVPRAGAERQGRALRASAPHVGTPGGFFPGVPGGWRLFAFALRVGTPGGFFPGVPGGWRLFAFALRVGTPGGFFPGVPGGWRAGVIIFSPGLDLVFCSASSYLFHGFSFSAPGHLYGFS